MRYGLWMMAILCGAFPVMAQTATPPAANGSAAASPATAPAFKQEELDQLLAPIALYPDDLLSQVLMASTYPLEIVQAKRWAESNAKLKGDALAVALEKQTWDPSVRSLINVPQTLDMMNKELDWTLKLGDAFLANQKAVLDTVQALRAKAKAAGNLDSTKEQTVKVETPAGSTTQTIVIQQANPQVIYVPTYDPAIIYGAWTYPAYPPHYYYPPSYQPGPGVGFAVGIAVGAAWGYAWGGCNWGHGDIDIDIDRNVNVNNNINRNQYKAEFNRNNTNVNAGNRSGSGSSWNHNPSHRMGAPYRDASTAKNYGQTTARPDRSDYKGFDSAAASQRRPTDSASPRDTSAQRDAAANRASAGNRDSASNYQDRSGQRGSMYAGVDGGSQRAKAEQSRGSSSRSSSPSRSSGGGGSRSGGGRGR